jgi:hypothetical protein
MRRLLGVVAGLAAAMGVGLKLGQSEEKANQMAKSSGWDRNVRLSTADYVIQALLATSAFVTVRRIVGGRVAA